MRKDTGSYTNWNQEKFTGICVLITVHTGMCLEADQKKEDGRLNRLCYSETRDLSGCQQDSVLSPDGLLNVQGQKAKQDGIRYICRVSNVTEFIGPFKFY